MNVAPGTTAQLAQGVWVSGGFFEMLGVTPHLGRLLTAADDRPGCGSAVAVLGYAFWKRRYQGDPAAIGRTITLDGRPFEIVGVAPRSFVGLEVGRRFDVATPICNERLLNAERSALTDRAWWWLAVVGRLAPGWTAERASAHLAALSADVFRITVPTNQGAGETDAYFTSILGAFPAPTGVSGTVREEYTAPLSVLLGLAVVVLVIASANIATLLLARATTRERDAAVRLALGASRGRLIRQLLMESALLAALGAVAGAVLAQPIGEGLLALVRSSGFQFFAIDFDLQPNWRVLLFAIGLSAATCVLFGLAPAVVATRPSRATLVRGLARTVADVRPRGALRGSLLVVQMSLALMLVIAALLFARTVRNLADDERGLVVDDVTAFVVMHQHLPVERRHETVEALLAAILALPDTRGATSAAMIPLTGESWSGRVMVDGVQRDRQAYFNRVSPGYFETLGTRLIAGRDFTAADRSKAPRVAIVNRSFARDMIGRADPIGATFAWPPRPGTAPHPIEVIGVVEDAKHLGLRDPFEPMAFFPVLQQANPPEYANLLVRLATPASTRAVAEAIARIEPTAVVLTIPLRAQIEDQTARERLLAVLSSAFAAVSTLLALLGLYGIVAFGVTERLQEIGIRMALGAGGRDVIRTILREGASLSIVGVVVGLGGAAIATPYLESLLFGLTPLDPPVFIGVALVFPLVTLVAAYVPSRRATRIDPASVLRGQ